MPFALPCSPGLAEAAGPLLDYLGLNRALTVDQLDVYLEHIVLGRPLDELGPAQDDQAPPHIRGLRSDDAILAENLLASPCLEPDSPHETILVKNYYERRGRVEYGPGPGQARVGRFTYTRMFTCPRMGSTVARRFREAEQRIGLSGSRASTGSGRLAYRYRRDRLRAVPQVGWFVDRDRTLREGPELPARAATLDDFLLVVHKITFAVDPALGFHLYGADLCLQAAERGMAVVCLGASAITTRGASACPGRFIRAPRSSPANRSTPAAGGDLVRRHRPRRNGVPAGEYAIPAHSSANHATQRGGEDSLGRQRMFTAKFAKFAKEATEWRWLVARGDLSPWFGG